MLDADWSTYEADGVTLVATVVANATPVDRRVRVRVRTDGTVMPPRRRGVPEAGWTDEGYAGVVPATGRLALGFACRGEVPDPPVEVVDEGRTSADATGPAPDGDPGPTDLLRDLGSPAPPRDAVPVGDGMPTDPAVGEATDPGVRAPDGGGRRTPDVPGPVADWLDDVARRVEGDGTVDDGEGAALRAVAARAAALADRREATGTSPAGDDWWSP